MKCLVKVSKNGRILVPKKIRESLQLSEGSKVCLELKNGVLIVSTVSQRLDSVRKQLNKNPEWRNFSVEQFIAEKRKEALAEHEDTEPENSTPLNE